MQVSERSAETMISAFCCQLSLSHIFVGKGILSRIPITNSNSSSIFRMTNSSDRSTNFDVTDHQSDAATTTTN